MGSSDTIVGEAATIWDSSGAGEAHVGSIVSLEGDLRSSTRLRQLIRLARIKTRTNLLVLEFL